jgi:hypothetical protein
MLRPCTHLWPSGSTRNRRARNGTTIRSSLTFLLYSALGLSLTPAPSAGQEEVIPLLFGEARIGTEPLPEVMVVLHRVSPDFQGEIDSVQAGADGSFVLQLPYVPDHEARSEVFFASVSFRDILYFGAAITDPVGLDSLYVIQAYDTMSVPLEGADLPIGVRNVFLEAEEAGWRVTDMFQVLNEGDRTLFSPTEGRVWSYPLPTDATEFELGQGDLPADAVRFSEGRLELYAPVPPGSRFLLVRYLVTGGELELPMPGRTDLVEVFLREPGPSAEFPPLVPDGPVELEPGNVFKRFAGEGLQDTVVRGTVAEEPWRPGAEGLGLLLAGLLAGAAVYAVRVRGGAGREEVPATRSRETLLLAIAKLDEEYESGTDPDPRRRERYASRRRKLLAELHRDV